MFLNRLTTRSLFPETHTSPFSVLPLWSNSLPRDGVVWINVPSTDIVQSRKNSPAVIRLSYQTREKEVTGRGSRCVDIQDTREKPCASSKAGDGVFVARS